MQFIMLMTTFYNLEESNRSTIFFIGDLGSFDRERGFFYARFSCFALAEAHPTTSLQTTHPVFDGVGPTRCITTHSVDR